MKVYFWIFIGLFFFQPLIAQVTTLEAFPNGEKEIHLLVDLKKATDNRANGLLGRTSDVYLWAGAGSTSNGNAFEYQPLGQNNFNQAFEKGKMLPLGNDIWSITLTPRVYFNVPQNVPIKRIGLLLKSADGKYQTEDLFLNLFSSDLAIKWFSPSQNKVIAEKKASIQLKCKFSAICQVQLFANQNLIWESKSIDSLEYTYNPKPEDPQNSSIVLSLSQGTSTLNDTINILYMPEPKILAVPNGIKEGVNYADTAVTFCLFAPDKKWVQLIGEFNSWKTSTDYQMNRSPDGQRFWISVKNLPKTETAYQYLVDGEITIADPFSEKILDPVYDPQIPKNNYPNLKTFPKGAKGIVSVIHSDLSPYSWKVSNFPKIDAQKLMIYEILIRDFLEEKKYRTLADTLPYLSKLGINAIELMPITEFTGNDSWGYNPTFYTCPDKFYGPANDLKYLIDQCHQNGIAVILDMVFNHADQDNSYAKMYWNGNRPSASNPFFNQQATHPYSVFFDFNHESKYTQWYIDKICEFWLKNYKIDGFRLDLSKGFTQVNSGDNVELWGKYDASRIKLLKRFYDQIKLIDPSTYVILEHFAEAREENELGEYGLMLWSNNKPELTNAVQGISSNLNGLSYLNRGFTKPQLVNYMESHDEERLFVELSSSSSPKIYSQSEKINRLQMASILEFAVPGPKMMWQFGEFGYSNSINSSGGRTAVKPTFWQEGSEPDLQKLKNTFAEIFHLRNKKEIFHSKQFTIGSSNFLKTIQIENVTDKVFIIANTDSKPATYLLNFPSTGTWFDYFSAKSFQVSQTSSPINLQGGEFHLFTKEKWNTTASTYVTWQVPDLTILGTKESPQVPNIYPNPSENSFLFSWWNDANTAKKIEIFDILGNLIYSKMETRLNSGFQQTNILFPQNTPAGIYFINFDGKSYKIIKSN